MPFVQHETSSAISGLTDLLNLSNNWSGDWALETADALRLDEFIKVYTAGRLDNDEKFALMSLIVASLDDYLCCTSPEQQDLAISTQVEHLLNVGFVLHSTTVESWCHFNASNTNDSVQDPWSDFSDEIDVDSLSDWDFQVTQMMRRIWDNHT